MSSLPKRNTFKLGFLFQDEVLVCQGKDPMKTLDTLGRLTKSFTLDPFLLRDSGTGKVGEIVEENYDFDTATKVLTTNLDTLGRLTKLSTLDPLLLRDSSRYNIQEQQGTA